MSTNETREDSIVGGDALTHREGVLRVPAILPDMRLGTEPDPARPGEPVEVRWDAGAAAEDVRLWIPAGLGPMAIAPDWAAIGRLGEAVERSGRRVFTPSGSTTIFLMARSSLGIAGRSCAIVMRAETAREPFSCDPSPAIRARMEVPMYMAHGVHPPSPLQMFTRLGGVPPLMDPIPMPPPTILMTVTTDVIFANESSTVSWTSTNASCLDAGLASVGRTLLADLIETSGTRPDGGSYGFGGSPPCVAAGTGSIVLAGAQFHHGTIWVWVKAHNTAGAATVADRWVCILTVPQFAGAATAQRQADVTGAIRTLVRDLRNGGIVNDASLDSSVAAFRDGHLNRAEFWSTLLTALENIGLVSFNCEQDTNTPTGQWKPHTNVITFVWRPTQGMMPNFPYILLHELAHKCGFHDGLLPYYSHADIENQADAVASSVYP